MSVDEDFVLFWSVFPRHVGKFAAQKAYRKARTVASAKQILDGVNAYKVAKPTYADWCMPATFLNQGRWLDEPDHAAFGWACPHMPPCGSAYLCDVQRRLGR